jgi:hypothetical protein
MFFCKEWSKKLLPRYGHYTVHGCLSMIEVSKNIENLKYHVDFAQQRINVL